MTWHVWTDGSCKYAEPGASRGVLGAGGWCAIVEHGHDGEVHRGRVPSTTNVRMELVAATRGLAAVPVGASAVLHTDCTTILCVLDSLEREALDALRGPDRAFWHDLAAEIAAREVVIDLLGKGVRDPIHRRAHGFAGAEARAMLKRMPPNVVPLERDRREERAHRRALAEAAGFRRRG